MKWTKKGPTIPGFYWLKEFGLRAEVVEVVKVPNQKELCVKGTVNPREAHDGDEDVLDEYIVFIPLTQLNDPVWYGPLKEPTDIQIGG